MIKLITLLFEDADTYESGEVWITKKRFYGAKSATGDIRYFMDREDAVKYATGKIKPPKVGRPEPKQHVQHHEPKEKYSSE
jgi:hypothetical protein